MSQNQQCHQLSPLVLIESGCSSRFFASRANFHPPYNWLTTALLLSTAFSFTSSEYIERSLSGSDSFCSFHSKKGEWNKTLAGRYTEWYKEGTYLHIAEGFFCATHEIFPEVIRAERLRCPQHVVVQAWNSLSTRCTDRHIWIIWLSAKCFPRIKRHT